MWIAFVNDTSSPSSADIRPFGCVLGGEKASKAFFNSAKLYDRYLPHEKERERKKEATARPLRQKHLYINLKIMSRSPGRLPPLRPLQPTSHMPANA